VGCWYVLRRECGVSDSWKSKHRTGRRARVRPARRTISRLL